MSRMKAKEQKQKKQREKKTRKRTSMLPSPMAPATSCALMGCVVAAASASDADILVSPLMAAGSHGTLYRTCLNWAAPPKPPGQWPRQSFGRHHLTRSHEHPRKVPPRTIGVLDFRPGTCPLHSPATSGLGRKQDTKWHRWGGRKQDTKMTPMPQAAREAQTFRPFRQTHCVVLHGVDVNLVCLVAVADVVVFVRDDLHFADLECLALPPHPINRTATLIPCPSPALSVPAVRPSIPRMALRLALRLLEMVRALRIRILGVRSIQDARAPAEGGALPGPNGPPQTYCQLRVGSGESSSTHQFLLLRFPPPAGFEKLRTFHRCRTQYYLQYHHQAAWWRSRISGPAALRRVPRAHMSNLPPSSSHAADVLVARMRG